MLEFEKHYLDNGYKLIRIKYTENHIERLTEELKKLYIL